MSVPSGSAVSLPPVTAAGLPAAVPYTPPCTVVTVPSLTAPPAWVGLPAGARRVANEESGTNRGRLRGLVLPVGGVVEVGVPAPVVLEAQAVSAALIFGRDEAEVDQP